VNRGGVSSEEAQESEFKAREHVIWSIEMAPHYRRRFNAKNALNKAQFNVENKEENVANRNLKHQRRRNRAAQNPGNATARQEANRAARKLANAQSALQQARNRAAAAKQAFNRVNVEISRLEENAKRRAKEAVNELRAKYISERNAARARAAEWKNAAARQRNAQAARQRNNALRREAAMRAAAKQRNNAIRRAAEKTTRGR
jgi:uncharacterized protein YdcH (DUF465 family)